MISQTKKNKRVTSSQSAPHFNRKKEPDVTTRIFNHLCSLHRIGLRNISISLQRGCLIISGKVNSFHERQLALSCCQQATDEFRIVDQVEVAEE